MITDTILPGAHPAAVAPPLQRDLPALTEEIVATYTTVGSLNHLDHCPLPKYDEIVAAIEDLKGVIYPGYCRREGLHIGNVEYHVGNLIDSLYARLSTQIARALLHRTPMRRSWAVKR